MLCVNDEFERLYQPSKWSNRFETAEEVLQFHIDFITRESKKVRNSTECQLNLTYGSDNDDKFDLFGVHLPTDSELIVFIHGGYWQEMSKDLYSFVANNFIKNERKVIIIGYSLSPNVSLEVIVNQISKAILKCYEFAQMNATKGLKIIGHSAGAHLIACQLQKLAIFSENLPPITLFLISGVYDLTDLTKTSINIALNLNEKRAKLLSPVTYNLPRTNCKIYVIAGQFDSPVFKQQSVQFFHKLQQIYPKENLSCYQLENVDHFEIVENFIKPNYQLVQLILTVRK